MFQYVLQPGRPDQWPRRGQVMHEAPETVSNGGIRRPGTNRDHATDLRFRRFP